MNWEDTLNRSEPDMNPPDYLDETPPIAPQSWDVQELKSLSENLMGIYLKIASVRKVIDPIFEYEEWEQKPSDIMSAIHDFRDSIDECIEWEA